MDVIKPSELWFDLCEREGLDRYDRGQARYKYFKKLFNFIKPPYANELLNKDDCWRWDGLFTTRGYPVIDNRMASREVHLLFKGPIGNKLKLFKVCRNNYCVNPFHTLQLTQGEILMRYPKTPVNRTHCPAGHLYNGANLYIDRLGRRRCRTCGRNQADKWRKKGQLKPKKGKRNGRRKSKTAV